MTHVYATLALDDNPSALFDTTGFNGVARRGVNRFDVTFAGPVVWVQATGELVPPSVLSDGSNVVSLRPNAKNVRVFVHAIVEV